MLPLIIMMRDVHLLLLLALAFCAAGNSLVAFGPTADAQGNGVQPCFSTQVAMNRRSPSTYALSHENRTASA